MNELSMRAYGENVIVKLTKTGGLTAGGLHIPDSAGREYKHYGTVVSVGSDVEDIESGDEIVFNVSKQFKTADDQEFFAVNKNEILAVLR